MTPNAVPVPLVPGASIHAQITRWLGLSVGVPMQGLALRLFWGFKGPLTLRDLYQVFFSGVPYKGFASTP